MNTKYEKNMSFSSGTFSLRFCRCCCCWIISFPLVLFSLISIRWELLVFFLIFLSLLNFSSLYFSRALSCLFVLICVHLNSILFSTGTFLLFLRTFYFFLPAAACAILIFSCLYRCLLCWKFDFTIWWSFAFCSYWMVCHSKANWAPWTVDRASLLGPSGASLSLGNFQRWNLWLFSLGCVDFTGEESFGLLLG